MAEGPLLLSLRILSFLQSILRITLKFFSSLPGLVCLFPPQFLEFFASHLLNMLFSPSTVCFPSFLVLYCLCA